MNYHFITAAPDIDQYYIEHQVFCYISGTDPLTGAFWRAGGVLRSQCQQGKRGNFKNTQAGNVLSFDENIYFFRIWLLHSSSSKLQSFGEYI